MRPCPNQTTAKSWDDVSPCPWKGKPKKVLLNLQRAACSTRTRRGPLGWVRASHDVTRASPRMTGVGKETLWSRLACSASGCLQRARHCAYNGLPCPLLQAPGRATLSSRAGSPPSSPWASLGRRRCGVCTFQCRWQDSEAKPTLQPLDA